MKITRIYTGNDGESHFENMDVSPHNTGSLSRQSPLPASGIFIEEIKDEINIGWHNSPRRQFVIIIEGSFEIEVGDGSKHIFQAGDIFLVEDITGKGHTTRSLNNQPSRTIWVTLD